MLNWASIARVEHRVECSPPWGKVAADHQSTLVLVVFLDIITYLLRLGQWFENKDHLAWKRPSAWTFPSYHWRRINVLNSHVLQEIFNFLVDTSHRSRIAPWEDATASGVTGIIFALMTTLDFLSTAFFRNLDISWSGICSWWTISLRRSLSGKSEGHVTSGVSRNTGDLIEVCIILATKMCLDVASGSMEKGVPW